MQGAHAPCRRLIFVALYYDLPVYQDVYRLILKLFEITRDFPREYKYTLGQDLKRDGIVLVRSIYRANKANNAWKQNFDNGNQNNNKNNENNENRVRAARGFVPARTGERG